MRINSNIPALTALRHLNIHIFAMSQAMERLSSGLRINRAADDAAGLAISEGMRAQFNGLRQASRNAQDGISLLQTAEGALNETHAILQRMRTLAVQASTGTYSDADRAAIQNEINHLRDEITRIASNTEFNTKRLLDGSFATNPITLHVGANSGQTISFNIADMSDLGIDGIDVSTQAGANDAIDYIDEAIRKVSSERSNMGAIQNRLQHTIRNLETTAENLQAAESRIRDADMALEMMNFVRHSILKQATLAVLAQANQSPRLILYLLRDSLGPRN